MADSKSIRETFDKHGGVFRLMPAFVPRAFGAAGRRLRLHPDDYYALGLSRGTIKERWFCSTVAAMNGPLAPPDEGLSYVAAHVDRPDDCFLFRDAVAELGAELIGTELHGKYGTWPMYAKFFDYEGPLFHHMHLDDDAAGRVGLVGKPEGYYFPPQLNNHMGQFPHTYFGWAPGTTREEVRERLLQFEQTDNRITELSRAYRIALGTGWYTAPGVMHAPGSVLTYEPQWNSDVISVFENVAAGEPYSHDLLVANVPEDRKQDVDYIMDLMDWEANVDPNYKERFFRPPVLCESSDTAHSEQWIMYGNDYFAAKELTIEPGQTVTVRDPVAYGCILVQGYGRFGSFDAETAVMLRYGQMSGDEYFVSEQAAQAGVQIENRSAFEPLVILKHFGPNHPDAPTA